MNRPGVLILAAAGVVGLAGGGAYLAMGPPEPNVEPVDSAQPAPRMCELDRGQITLDVRPDPGFGDPDLRPVVPALRSYMPARFRALVCPKIDCTLPSTVAGTVWATSREGWRNTSLPLDNIPRGKCVELQLQSTADEVWPGAGPGVVRWALVVGEVPSPGDPERWLAAGRSVWLGDVVHAGLDGTPNVH